MDIEIRRNKTKASEIQQIHFKGEAVILMTDREGVPAVTAEGPEPLWCTLPASNAVGNTLKRTRRCW